mmetsp:Transcript_33191/g.69848  ORF Transcript_33191/g.69848 Transcript_33191/m.69848 type:complete len:86 (+) Transcript_33191:667-924(+)
MERCWANYHKDNSLRRKKMGTPLSKDEAKHSGHQAQMEKTEQRNKIVSTAEDYTVQEERAGSMVSIDTRSTLLLQLVGNGDGTST